MGNQRAVHNPASRRYGLTRFIVPHDTFKWYTRSIALSTLATGAISRPAIYSQKLYEAMGLPPMAQDPSMLADYNRFTMITIAVVVVVGTLYITTISAPHRVVGVYRFEHRMKTCSTATRSSPCASARATSSEARRDLQPAALQAGGPRQARRRAELRRLSRPHSSRCSQGSSSVARKVHPGLRGPDLMALVLDRVPLEALVERQHRASGRRARSRRACPRAGARAAPALIRSAW